MSDKFEFSIDEKILAKMLHLKNEMGFGSESWDLWFNNIIEIIQKKKPNQSQIEKIMEKMYYERLYENWIANFAINLEHIWKEPSANDLSLKFDSAFQGEANSAIVIGSGPSIKKSKHMELLANSNYNGKIICCDSSLRNALSAGVTPDKFPEFYVVTIDTDEIIKRYYDEPVVDRYGNKIRGIFSSVVPPLVTERARKAGIKVPWLHSLFDYDEGKKSFNLISASMVRAKKQRGLPAIQTGGNVGTSAWFVGWRILKCGTIGLIGINHSWDEDTPLEDIISHGSGLHHMEIDRNSDSFQKLFPKVYNPEFNCQCILDPYFQYYSNALKDFIARSPSWVTTINATEGGCIFGKRILCMRLAEFLEKHTK